jgi:hypothetical protein
MGKNNVSRLSVGKTEGQRPPGRPRCRWVGNIKLDFVEIGWGGVDWISLAQEGSRGSSSECGNEHSASTNAGKLLSGYTSGGFSSSAQLHRLSQSAV